MIHTIIHAGTSTLDHPFLYRYQSAERYCVFMSHLHSFTLTINNPTCILAAVRSRRALRVVLLSSRDMSATVTRENT